MYNILYTTFEETKLNKEALFDLTKKGIGKEDNGCLIFTPIYFIPTNEHEKLFSLFLQNLYNSKYKNVIFYG